MREIRQSGSEGGGTLTGPSYPYTWMTPLRGWGTTISSQPRGERGEGGRSPSVRMSEGQK